MISKLFYLVLLCFLYHNVVSASYDIVELAPTDKTTVKLNDGHLMPILGFGTFKLHNQTLITAIKDAINAGYRHIDTAYHYENEKEVGEAIKQVIAEGKVKRKDIFITTKVWNTFHSRSKVFEAAKLSQHNLGLDYIDLLLIHYPYGEAEGKGMEPKDKNGNIIFTNVDYLETWQGMEDVHDAKIAKSIGVSNFNHKQLERITQNAKVKPVVNQVESHPYFQQVKHLEFCNNHSIVMTGFSPLAQGGEIFKEKSLQEIADKHNKSIAQVAIRFQVQRNVVVIPRSSNKGRIAENLNVFDFELTHEDLEIIGKLERNGRIDFGVPGSKFHKYYPFNEPY